MLLWRRIAQEIADRVIRPGTARRRRCARRSRWPFTVIISFLLSTAWLLRWLLLHRRVFLHWLLLLLLAFALVLLLSFGLLAITVKGEPQAGDVGHLLGFGFHAELPRILHSKAHRLLAEISGLATLECIWVAAAFDDLFPLSFRHNP